MLSASLSALVLAALVQAQNVIQVQVGSTANAQGGIFQYIPNSITAKQGDIVMFNFSGAPGNHTVTQSTLANPCTPMQNGFDSGWVFIPNANVSPTPTWNLTITDDSKPLWFYCKQTQPQPHCGVGMVGAINANDTAMATFRQNAQGNTSPGEGVGLLVGQGASASAPPGPITNGVSAYGVPTGTAPTASGTAPSSPSGTGGSGSGSGSGTGGASTIYVNTFAAILAAVVGVSLA